MTNEKNNTDENNEGDDPLDNEFFNNLFKNFNELDKDSLENISKEFEGLNTNDISDNDFSQIQNLMSNLMQGMNTNSNSSVNWDIANKIAPVLANSSDEESMVQVQANESSDPDTSVMAFEFLNKINETSNTEEPVGIGDINKLINIAKVSQNNVAQSCGFIHVLEGSVDVVNKTELVDYLLTSIKPFFESISSTLKRTFNTDSLGLPRDEDEIPSQENMMLEQIAPTMLGAQAGSMIGYLCRSALDASELLTFSSEKPNLVVCAPNLTKFALDWSLNQDTFFLYALTIMTIRVGQRSVPWVKETINKLSQDFANTYNFSSQHVAEHLNLSEDIDGIEDLDSKPEMVLGALRTEEQEAVLATMRKFLSILEGYVSVVGEQIAKNNGLELGLIKEAMRRHQIERGAADKFMNMFLGIDLGDKDLAIGETFCRGVIERSLEEDSNADPLSNLNKLFENKNNWPTEAELEAPGLWLARIEYM